MKKIKSKILISSILIPINLAVFSSCSLNVKYPNITISCIGDSITWGARPKTLIRMLYPYPKLLKKRLSVGTVNNYGISGSTVSNGNGSFSPMVDRIKQIDPKSNIIVFWGGVNDYINNCELGVKGSTNSTDFYGAINNCCNYLKNNFSDKFIMFITPLPTTRTSTKNKLEEYCEAIKYNCSLYSIPVLDLYKNSGFENEMNKWYSDGLHPSQKFVKNTMTPIIEEFIRQYYIFRYNR